MTSDRKKAVAERKRIMKLIAIAAQSSARLWWRGVTPAARWRD